MWTDLLFNLVFTRIASLNIKLGVVHFGSSLVKKGLLAGTVPTLLVKLDGKLASLHDKVVVRESQSSGLEVAMLVTAVRARHSFMVVVVIRVVLLRHWRLLLWTNLFTLLPVYFWVWAAEYTDRLFKITVLLRVLLGNSQSRFWSLCILLTIDTLQVVLLCKSTSRGFGRVPICRSPLFYVFVFLSFKLELLYHLLILYFYLGFASCLFSVKLTYWSSIDRPTQSLVLFNNSRLVYLLNQFRSNEGIFVYEVWSSF